MRRTYRQNLTVIATAMTVPLLFLAGPAQAQPPEDGGPHRVERQDRDKDRAGRHPAKSERDTEGKQAKADRHTEGKQAKAERDTEGKQSKAERDSEGKQAQAERDSDGKQVTAERDTEGKQPKAEREADREQRRHPRDDKGSAGGGKGPAQPEDSDKEAAADDPLELPLLAPPTSEPIRRPTPADAPPPVTNDPADEPEPSDDGNQAAESPPAPAGPPAPPAPAAPVAEPVDAPVSDPEPATAGPQIASLWPIGGPSVGSVVVAAPDVPRTFPGVITDDTPISDAVPLLLIVLGVFLAVQRGIGHGLGHVPMSGAVGRDRHGRG